MDDFAPGPGPGTAGIPDVGDDVVIANNVAGCNSIPEIVGGGPPPPPPPPVEPSIPVPALGLASLLLLTMLLLMAGLLRHRRGS